MQQIINALEERLRSAEADRRDHKSDPQIVQRELLGYWRGLNDAIGAVRAESKRDPQAVELRKVIEQRDRLLTYLQSVATASKEMLDAHEVLSRE